MKDLSTVDKQKLKKKVHYYLGGTMQTPKHYLQRFHGEVTLLLDLYKKGKIHKHFGDDFLGLCHYFQTQGIPTRISYGMWDLADFVNDLHLVRLDTDLDVTVDHVVYRVFGPQRLEYTKWLDTNLTYLIDNYDSFFLREYPCYTK